MDWMNRFSESVACVQQSSYSEVGEIERCVAAVYLAAWEMTLASCPTCNGDIWPGIIDIDWMMRFSGSAVQIQQSSFFGINQKRFYEGKISSKARHEPNGASPASYSTFNDHNCIDITYVDFKKKQYLKSAGWIQQSSCTKNWKIWQRIALMHLMVNYAGIGAQLEIPTTITEI